jgi:hypothetical protein
MVVVVNVRDDCGLVRMTVPHIRVRASVSELRVVLSR